MNYYGRCTLYVYYKYMYITSHKRSSQRDNVDDDDIY